MGLSFHYSCNFNSNASLTDLIEDIKDIAEAQQWEYFIYETAFPAGSLGKEEFDRENLYGISFAPPECELVCFCFLSNGRLASPSRLQLYSDPMISFFPESYLRKLYVKTQFAGAETHAFIIELFRYIAPKYLTDFTLQDEGEYWETGNMELLRQHFGELTAVINIFKKSLKNTKKVRTETIEEYLQRVIKNINEKRQKGQ